MLTFVLSSCGSRFDTGERTFDSKLEKIENTTNNTKEEVLALLEIYGSHFIDISDSCINPEIPSVDFSENREDYDLILEKEAFVHACQISEYDFILSQVINSLTQATAFEELSDIEVSEYYFTYNLFIEGETIVIVVTSTFNNADYIKTDQIYISKVDGLVYAEINSKTEYIEINMEPAYEYSSYYEGNHITLVHSTERFIHIRYVDLIAQKYMEYEYSSTGKENYYYVDYLNGVTVDKKLDGIHIVTIYKNGRLAIDYSYLSGSDSTRVFLDALTLEGWTNLACNDGCSLYNQDTKIELQSDIAQRTSEGGYLGIGFVFEGHGTESELMLMESGLIPAYTYEELSYYIYDVEEIKNNFVQTHFLDFTNIKEKDFFEMIVEEFHSNYIE